MRRINQWRVTPLMLTIAVHYYTTGSDTEAYGASVGRADAPAVVEQTKLLVDAGLLRPVKGPRRFEQTAGLGVWIDALCQVPFPVMQWRIPEDAA